MSTEDGKVIVQHWIEAWNDKDLDAAEELLAAAYVRHDSNLPEIVGPSAQRQFILSVFDAFPDIHFEFGHLIAEGELVAAHLSIAGTQRGEFLGVPPTDTRVAFQSQEIYRLDEGKISEQWVIMDALGLFQQLGAIPVPASS